MFLLIRAGTAIGCNPQLLVSNRMVLLRIRDLDHMLKHKKPSMIHTVDQFVMKGGKMKKLHFGSKNQNAAFNIVGVSLKDLWKSSNINGL